MRESSLIVSNLCSTDLPDFQALQNGLKDLQQGLDRLKLAEENLKQKIAPLEEKKDKKERGAGARIAKRRVAVCSPHPIDRSVADL